MTQAKKSGMDRKPNHIDKEIGFRIRKYRTSKGLTQSDLAEHLGISFQQVQKYELGHNRIAASKLYSISQALGVSPDAFFADLEDNTPHEDMAAYEGRDTLNMIKCYHVLPNEIRQQINMLIKSMYECYQNAGPRKQP